MPEQLTFELPTRAARGRDDFFVSPANALALAMLDAWPDWPEGRLLITGPAASGKSHLGSVWAARSGAQIIEARALDTARVPELAAACVVVEDIDTMAPGEGEQALFHLLNMARAQGQSVLMTAPRGARALNIVLPDLASRVQAVTSVALEPPDEVLLGALLIKLFHDRQIHVPANLIPYLQARMERSFAAAQDIVARLDAEALRSRAPITRAMARRLLDMGGGGA